jgi:hypothetical protein
MSARITWQPSTDADIDRYELERAVSIGGPWALLQTITHNLSDAGVYDPIDSVFFYVDVLGTSSTYYRLTAIDALNQRSPVSPPFRAAGPSAGSPALVNVVSIVVGDVATLLDLGFTSIEIYEATLYANESWEITAPAAGPARVVSAKSGFFRMGGATLTFVRNGGAPQSVSFPDTIIDWTAAQLAAVINDSEPGCASVVDGCLVLSSITTGRTSSLQVTSAPTLLGLPAEVVYGTDSRLLLVDGQSVYAYYDVAGASSSRYQWRFSANGSNPISKMSALVSGKTVPISGVALSFATARFIGLDGRPAKMTVLVAAENNINISGFTVQEQQTQAFSSDENGYFFIPLVQGARVRIAIEGTSLVRTLTVPNTASFDLMQALSDAPDQFTVQTVPPLLTRRSL